MVKTISNTPLLEGLRLAGSERGGDVWIRAMGTVSGLELACGDRVIGPVDGTLVSLDALVVDDRIEATATVAVEVGGVPVTVSGVLVGGAAGEVHAMVISAALPSAERESAPRVDPSREVRDEQPSKSEAIPAPPRATAARAPEPAPQRAASAPSLEPRRSAASSVGAAAAAASTRKSVGWGDVAAVSAKVAAGALDDDDGEVDVDELDRGDTIDHPTLEKCVVVGVLGDDAVKVRLVNGSVRKLVMRGFRLYREGDHHFRIERKT